MISYRVGRQCHVASYDRNNGMAVLVLLLEVACQVVSCSRAVRAAVQSSQVKSSRVKSSQVEASRVRAGQVKATRKSGRVRSSQGVSGHVLSSAVQWSRIKSRHVGPMLSGARVSQLPSQHSSSRSRSTQDIKSNRAQSVPRHVK